MTTLSESHAHGSEPLVAPARNTRLAVLIAALVAAVVGIAVTMDRPGAPDTVQSATTTPLAERTYDGRGKWTGY